MSTAVTRSDTPEERPDEILPIFAEYQGKIDEILAALDIPDPHAVPSFLGEVNVFVAAHAKEREDEIAAEVLADLAKQEPLRLSEDEPQEEPKPSPRPRKKPGKHGS